VAESMNSSLHVAIFVGAFPEISETFIIRQITALIDLGHAVDIYADARSDSGAPLHPEVTQYRLLERTTYMDMPPEIAPFEMPVMPITGRTWPPGSETSIHNSVRLARATPKFLRSLCTAPALTLKALRPADYQYQAASLSALYRLAKLCETSKHYDVLHAHFGPIGNSFRFARDLWRAPLVVSFHGYDLCTVPRNEGPAVYRNLFETVDGVTAHSDYARGRLTQLGCPDAKIHRLHVGVNPLDFPFRPRTLNPGEPIRILTVARLVEIKGLAYAIQALALLHREHPNLRYEIIGDGPDRNKLAALIRELGLEGRVYLLGACASNEVRARMASAHLFVLPSINLDGDQEGTPVTLMEAQVSGLPVVSTRTGGIPEVMTDGHSGFLVADRDPKALAERLRFLIEHPEIWPELGSKGRTHIEQNYDVRKLNDQLVHIYRRIVNQYSTPHKPAGKS
jgi:colanic acid/amylovoran biosynthesis glycosyltransferase